jgi:hypothetical protein
LTTCAKKSGQAGKKIKIAREEFRAPVQERWTTAGRWLALVVRLLVRGSGPAGDQWSSAGHGPHSAKLRATLLPPFFLLFFYFSKLFFWCYEEVWGWAWHFERMGVQYSHFLNLAPTLGKVKSSIPHGAWRFHFFPSFFAKIRVYQ